METKILDALIKKHGPVIFRKENGFSRPTVNERLFAAWFSTLYPTIWSDKTFWLYDENSGVWKNSSVHDINNALFEKLTIYQDATSEPKVNRLRIGNQMQIVRNSLQDLTANDDAFSGEQAYLYHAKNGMVCLSENGDLELRNFSPKYKSRWQSPILYDKTQVPKRFLTDLIGSAMGDDEQKLLQFYIGQCIRGRNDSQTFLLLIGTPGGGKSMLVNIVEKLIGRENIGTLRLNSMDGRFEAGRLRGRTLLTAKDVKPDFLNSSGAPLLKALTGSDLVEVELKQSNARPEILGQFNVIITSNSVLQIILNSDIEAWRRRIILINYENPPPKEKIMNFDDVLLKEEGSGILNWGIEGLLQLRQHHWNIPKSPAQQAKIDILLKSADPVTTFVRSFVKPNPNASFATKDALLAFHLVCEKLHWGTLTDRQVELQLKRAMALEHKLNGRNDIICNGRKNRGYAGAYIVLPEDYRK